MNRTYAFISDTSKMHTNASAYVYPLSALTSKLILPEMYNKINETGVINIYVDEDIPLAILAQLEKDFKGPIKYHLSFTKTPAQMIVKLSSLQPDMRKDLLKYYNRDVSYFEGKNNIVHWSD